MSKKNSLISRLKSKANALKIELAALVVACKRKDVPWYAKLWAALVVGYALSPIDLIPDFIPVLGYLDDLILVPLGIALAIKLIPHEIMNACREEGKTVFEGKNPRSYIAAALIILFWLAILAVIIF